MFKPHQQDSTDDDFWNDETHDAGIRDDDDYDHGGCFSRNEEVPQQHTQYRDICRRACKLKNIYSKTI